VIDMKNSMIPGERAYVEMPDGSKKWGTIGRSFDANGVSWVIKFDDGTVGELSDAPMVSSDDDMSMTLN
jgi:hypothetical protein